MRINRVFVAILSLAGIFAMPARGELNYLRLYMVGAATPAGWDNAHILPEEMASIGNDCFLWDGYMEVGDFKFINTRGDWGSSVVATDHDLAFQTGVSYDLRDNTNGGFPDHKFYNSKAGWVRVIVDLRNLKVNFRRPVLGLVGDAAKGWGLEKKVIPVFADDSGKAEWSGQLRRGEIKFLAGDCDDWSPCYNAPAALDELWSGAHQMCYNDGQGSAEDHKYLVPVSGYYTLHFKNGGAGRYFSVDVETQGAPALDGVFTGRPGRYLTAVDRDALRVHLAPVPTRLYIGTSGSDCQEISSVGNDRFSAEVYLQTGKYYKLSSNRADWTNYALSPNTDVDISSGSTSNVAPMHGYSYTVPTDGTYLVTADFSGATPLLSGRQQIPSGFDEPISDTRAWVRILGRDIVVEGDYSQLLICDVAGRVAATASPCHVSPGIYLVKVDRKVFKITVR